MRRLPLGLAALALLPFLSPAAAGEPRTDRSGDPLPDGALARLGTARLRHGAVVQTVAVSPDGQTLACADEGGQVVLWDAATGRELRQLARLPSYSVHALAFSPDGRTLVGAGDSIWVWQAASGRELFRLKDAEYESYKAAAFAPDGKTFATGSAGHHVTTLERSGVERTWDQESVVCLWDAATGQKLCRFPGLAAMIEGVAFSPDGKAVASASRDHSVRLWDAATGRELRSLEVNDVAKARVAFAPDGQSLAYGDWEGAVVVWDLGRGAEARRFPAGRQPVESLAFAPDGRSLLSGTRFDGSVRLWDPATGQELPGPAGLGRQACFGAFTPDGKSLVGWGCDNLIHVWDLAGRRERLPAEGHPYRICSLCVSPDGQRVATAGYDGLRLWDRATGRELWRSEANREEWVWGVWLFPFRRDSTWCVAFAPDGKTLASGGGGEGVRLWDAATGRELRRITTDESRVFDLAFAPDGRTLYTGGFYLAEARDAATGRLIRQKGRRPSPEEGMDRHRKAVSSLCASGDGRLVAANVRHRLRLWQADTGEEVLGLPGLSHARSATFSADGTTLLATGSEDGIQGGLWRWDVGADGAGGWRAPDPFGCRSLCFGPDGRTVASACRDGRVVLWDADTGQPRCTFRRHRGEVSGAVFSADGRVVVSYGEDGTALVWDAAGRAPPLPGGQGRGPGWWNFWSAAPLAERDSEDPDEDRPLEGALGLPVRARVLRWAAAVVAAGLLAACAIAWLRGRRKEGARPRPD